MSLFKIGTDFFFLVIYFNLGGSSDILFGVYQPIEVLPEYPCEFTSLPIDYRKLGNGMLFQKDWPYTKLINHQLYHVSVKSNALT